MGVGVCSGGGGQLVDRLVLLVVIFVQELGMKGHWMSELRINSMSEKIRAFCARTFDSLRWCCPRQALHYPGFLDDVDELVGLPTSDSKMSRR